MRKKSLLIFLLFSTLFFSQNRRIDSLQNKYEILELEKKILVLENQIEIIESTNNKILNTVYWTLGGLMTIFVTIIGLNFFQNFNINKKKIDSIKFELNNEIFKAVNTMNESIFKTNKELKKDLKNNINSGIKNSLESFDEKIKNLDDNYKEVYRSELIRKAFEHKEKGQMGYIYSLIELLELDIEKGYQFRIHESLKFINECFNSKFNVNSDSITRLNTVLKKLPEEFDIQKKNLQSKIEL